MISEKDLWRAVLLQAIDDLTGSHAARAKSWLLSEASALASFHWICNSLNLDPEAVRRRAFSLAAAQTAKAAVIRSPIQSPLHILDT